MLKQSFSHIKKVQRHNKKNSLFIVKKLYIILLSNNQKIIK